MEHGIYNLPKDSWTNDTGMTLVILIINTDKGDLNHLLLYHFKRLNEKLVHQNLCTK